MRNRRKIYALNRSISPLMYTNVLLLLKNNSGNDDRRFPETLMVIAALLTINTALDPAFALLELVSKLENFWNR